MQGSDIGSLVKDKKYLFFGGKGGVGKTTMAAATAVWLSDHGYDTLVVATDPTVSLSSIFEQKIGETTITRIGDQKKLSGLSINPRKAVGVFQTRMNSMIDGFSTIFGSDLLSTPCTEEIAAFDQFVSFMGDTDHDKVVFDTAPTGHTLRELSMPFDWSGYISNQITHRKELSETLGYIYDENMIADLKEEKERYDAAIRALSDETVSSFILVLLPEKMPIDETERAVTDLGKFGINVRSMIVNEVIPLETIDGNRFLERRRATQDRYLKEIDSRFKGISHLEVPLFDSDIYGLETLRKVGGALFGH